METHTDIPASWEVTSDSLALWFAEKINAAGLILVKSAPSPTNDISALAATGYLDTYFPQMMEKTSVNTITCIGVDEHEVLRKYMTDRARKDNDA